MIGLVAGGQPFIVADGPPVPGDPGQLHRGEGLAQVPQQRFRGVAVLHVCRGDQDREQQPEITFRGKGGRTLRAQFDDYKVMTNPETTTLRAELPDNAALSGLVERIVGLGLEIIDVHQLTQPSLP
ncbi:MAG TPA: hypothetical protein VGI66_13210 [Streptosporangiaceae bacterium]|jgi:hypothetical protein